MNGCGIIGTGLLCLALAACQKPAPPEAAMTPEPAPVQAESPPPQPPRPPRKPPVPQAPAEVARVEPGEIPTPAPNPERLIGLDQPATQALLGEPGERAEAAPATIWRYTGRNCEIEIYFYLDLKSQVMRALHYEVRSHDPAEPNRSRCFADLVAEHKADPDHPASADPPR